MINRIKSLLSGGAPAQDAAPGHSFAELQVAAAALLVEAAEMDANFGEAERRKIIDLVRARFELTEAEAESLLEIAGDKVANHHLEASLMRRVAGLIYVPDRESGEARKRALSKLGLDG
jgi:uncharacterized tellurite resistance protein B-like protein